AAAQEPALGGKSERVPNLPDDAIRKPIDVRELPKVGLADDLEPSVPDGVEMEEKLLRVGTHLEREVQRPSLVGEGEDARAVRAFDVDLHVIGDSMAVEQSP